MPTGLFTHPAARAHRMPPGHPEQIARIERVEAALADLPLIRQESPLPDRADLLRCHPDNHLTALENATPDAGLVAIDGDTFLSPGTWTAALRAVGGACAAVDAVLTGDLTNAFVATRPPGHHAETAQAMGFCLLGTVAIAAKRAIHHHGLKRVAVVDFDVHHGNGTQDLLWHEPAALFISTHQMPLYPGSGAAHETGAHGNVLNVPLRAGSGSSGLRAAYETLVFPSLDAFAPELILISAGFDAHQDDPLGGLGWQTQDFAWLTARLCDIAQTHCAGRVVSCLEGGYDLDALAASVAAHVGTLQEHGT